MLEPGTPAIRAAQLRENVDALPALGVGAPERVRALFDRALLHEIERAHRLEWMPAAYDVALIEVVDRIYGREAMVRFAKASVAGAFRSPPLRPLLLGAVQLFGVSAEAFHRVLFRSWGSVFRDCGQLQVEANAAGATQIIWHDAPRMLVTSAAYLARMEAAMLAVLEATGVAGMIAADEPTSDGRVLFRVLRERGLGGQSAGA